MIRSLIEYERILTLRGLVALVPIPFWDSKLQREYRGAAGLDRACGEMGNGVSRSHLRPLARCLQQAARRGIR